jgi:hypothetical protein
MFYAAGNMHAATIDFWSGHSGKHDERRFASLVQIPAYASVCREGKEKGRAGRIYIHLHHTGRLLRNCSMILALITLLVIALSLALLPVRRTAPLLSQTSVGTPVIFGPRSSPDMASLPTGF